LQNGAGQKLGGFYHGRFRRAAAILIPEAFVSTPGYPMNENDSQGDSHVAQKHLVERSSGSSVLRRICRPGISTAVSTGEGHSH